MYPIILAWFQWNPSVEAFRIPFLDHPVTWYGILFSSGFMLGYLLMIAILKKTLFRSNKLATRHVLSWNQLIKELKESSLIHQLSKKGQQGLETLEHHQEPNQELKEEILSALNRRLKNGELTRTQLEQELPEGLYSSHAFTVFLADRVTWFVVISTVIGARLGHVFFYGWEWYRNNLLSILKVWEGGLASHGACIGILLALYLCSRMYRRQYPEITFVRLVDLFVIPVCIGMILIRMGNFINQEILGTITTVPWAVVFGSPADGSIPMPRHPVQLYEGVAYLAIFAFLYRLWATRGATLRPGILSGLFLITAFSARFIMEFYKENLDAVIDTSFLQMGQLLSIPFILIGIGMILYGKALDSKLAPAYATAESV